MDKVKLAIVGCGATIRYMYGPILKYLKPGEVVAAVDPDLEQAEWASQFYNIPRSYPSIDEMLAVERIDAAVVGSPVYAHRDQVVQLAEAGVHVFCEKPMARTLEECDEMTTACQQAGVVLMLGFMKRFNKCFQKATQMIEDGSLGQVFQIRSEWSWYHPVHSDPRLPEEDISWRDKLETWGGLFQDHGSHTIDLARWWLGDVATVSGEVKMLGKAMREVEDYAVAVIRHVNGSVSIHLQTHYRPGGHLEYYEITGTEGRLEVIHGLLSGSALSMEPFRMFLWTGENRREDVTPYNTGNRDLELMQNNQSLKEMEHFCDCVLNSTTPVTTAENGRAALEGIIATYTSSWQGIKVRLPLISTPDLEAGFKALRKSP